MAFPEERKAEWDAWVRRRAVEKQLQQEEDALDYQERICETLEAADKAAVQVVEVVDGLSEDEALMQALEDISEGEKAVDDSVAQADTVVEAMESLSECGEASAQALEDTGSCTAIKASLKKIEVAASSPAEEASLPFVDRPEYELNGSSADDDSDRPAGNDDEAEIVQEPVDKTADKNASVKTQKNRFQVKTKLLSQKDIELFFRPRSGPGSCVVSSDEEAVKDAVSQDVDAEEAVEELVVAVSQDMEAEEAVDEPVAQVETMRPKLPKRKRPKGVPCECTIPGPCSGQQFSSQKTLNVHLSKKHGDHTKAKEKTAHDNALQAKNRKKRRKEDPDWREKERVSSAAYRKKKKMSLPHFF